MRRPYAMHVAMDVQYSEAEDRARAAAVTFTDWTAGAVSEHVRDHHGLVAYLPGQFYRRELPCLLPLLDELAVAIDTVVVDGYVDLGGGRPGLGRHLWQAVGRGVEVVGIAKSPFAGNDALEVRRPGSSRPLWVTSTGDAAAAARRVAAMHGAHRIPTLLGLVDRLARAL